MRRSKKSMYFMRTTEGRILDIALILALFIGIIVMVHSCVECKRQLRETPPYVPPRGETRSDIKVIRNQLQVTSYKLREN